MITNFNYKSVFISDLHLGNTFSDTELLAKYLSKLKMQTEKLYLVGDIFDAWRIDKADDFSALFDGFHEIIYIEGNHDLHFSLNNPIGVVAKTSQTTRISLKKGFVTHGHYFDSKINQGNAFGRLLDKLVYSISKRLKWNLRNLTSFMRRSYSLKLELKVAKKVKSLKKDFVIIGHTHEGGKKILGDIHVFNLGSWLTTPWAFYITGDNKYAISKIEKTNLFPESKDIHDIW